VNPPTRKQREQRNRILEPSHLELRRRV